jgi:tripartite-type tricarboxylate transporter receptor subunit TctC
MVPTCQSASERGKLRSDEVSEVSIFFSSFYKEGCHVCGDRRIWVSLLVIGLLLLTACASLSTGEGNAYPARSITYMIPFEPGGQSDIEARRQQPILEKELGQKIVITYKPGAGGAVGWSELVRQKPDGYYMAGINIPHIILQPLANEDTGFQADQIEPIMIFQSTPIGLAVRKDSGIRSLEEFIEKAKKNPGTITVAGSGSFSGHHLAFEKLQKLAGIQMKYIPFTGGAPQMQGFLGGNAEAVLANSNDLVSYKEQIRILAIGTEQRFEALPDVPTFKESGLDMTASIDRGVGVPKGTPRSVKETLENAFKKVTGNSKIREQMIKEGFEPRDMGMAESEAYIREKTNEFQPLIEWLKQHNK